MTWLEMLAPDVTGGDVKQVSDMSDDEGYILVQFGEAPKMYLPEEYDLLKVQWAFWEYIFAKLQCFLSKLLEKHCFVWNIHRVLKQQDLQIVSLGACCPCLMWADEYFSMVENVTL